MIDGLDRHEQLATKYLNDDGLKQVLFDYVAKKIYEELRRAGVTLHERAILLCALATGCAATLQGGGHRVDHSSVESSNAAQFQAVDGLQHVTVVNELSSCIALTPQQLFLVGSVEIGFFGLTQMKSIGECGCVSSAIEYRVSQKQEEPEGELPPEVPPLDPIQRVLGSVDVTQDLTGLSLVISPDRNLYGEDALTLAIACLGPQ